jgi:hypothetical protein
MNDFDHLVEIGHLTISCLLKGGNMKKALKLFFALAFVCAFFSLVFSQTPTGSIEGVVTDPHGNVVSGAAVSITETTTGRTINLTTNNSGNYTVRSLQPGVYSVKIEKQGFSTATAERVVVQVGQVARADVGLKVGSATETVQVDIGATDIQVDTTRQTVDGVITGRQITALPLNTRNFLDLAVLQPGVTVVDGGNIDPTKVNAYRAVRVNGGSGTGTRVAIEGIDVTDETVGTTVANFSTDAVQEFQLSRSSFDLSTSLTTSGAISVATRTGGNKFSGSGFYFKQDDRFDARPGFEATKPNFNRDQEGYRFGGRIIKDRLFFFSNFERFNQLDFSAFTSARFPSFNASSTLPIVTRSALNRIDGVVTDTIKVFYLHNFSDDASTGGTIRSPFQNVDWTNTHVIGANITGSRFTHSIRLGYVNFNNRIESQELSSFPFPVSGGVPIQINVGTFSMGPNTLAPQQTYQDNFQYKYDGSTVLGAHILRYGGEANHIILGGFANFAGPAQATGDSASSSSGDPLDYVLSGFQVGPNAGFFTPTPAHNLPFGGRIGTRYAFFGGDQWKIRRNLTLNFGLRWNYETNFFGGANLPRLSELDRFAPNEGDPPKYPKNAFSPQFGFAWDPWGKGKTSIRGGFYLAYEANIFNNSLFDAEARIALGISPSAFDDSTGVFGPDGSPVVVNGIPGCLPADVAAGDYSCMVDGARTIGQALPYIAQINNALQAAYANLSGYNPNTPPNEFTAFNGEGEVVYGRDYKIPYSMQFNIGIQHQLFKNNVLSVDYVRQRGVGLPVQLFDFEHRRDARYFDEAAARSKIGGIIGQSPANVNPTTIGAWLATRPTASITQFALANDVIWPGVSDLVNARLTIGGFSLYQGIQVTLNGRFGSETLRPLSIRGHQLLNDSFYTVSYAFAKNEATSGIGRPEFLASATNNRDLNADFGPSGLDRRHNMTISASLGLIGGFRLDQIYRFQTSAPQNLRIPNNRSTSGIFTSDFNGDGGNGTTPRVDTVPGTNIGAFGTRISNIDQLNAALTNYNNTNAGHLTPAGQRLVDAGIFSEAQLVALGATLPFIPLVPAGNPNPFQNLFTADYRLSRPIKIWKEHWVLEPNISFFNVFNNAAKGQYAGLAIPALCTTLSHPENNCPGAPGGLVTNRTGVRVSTFGALNYDYKASELPALTQARGLRQNRRQLQFGIRFSF